MFSSDTLLCAKGLTTLSQKCAGLPLVVIFILWLGISKLRFTRGYFIKINCVFISISQQQILEVNLKNLNQELGTCQFPVDLFIQSALYFFRFSETFPNESSLNLAASGGPRDLP